MSSTIYGMTNYYNLFASPVQSYSVSPITNLIYGSTASKVYAQTFAKKTQSVMSSYLSSLNSNIAELKSSSKELTAQGSDSIFKDKAVSSSDANSAIGSANSNANENDYTLNVTKLAKSQENTGASLNSNASDIFDIGLSTFSLKVGNIEKNISFTYDFDDTNKSGLSKMASAINNSKSGVTASVFSNTADGTSHLFLKSDKTGTESSFNLKDLTGNAVFASGIGTVSSSAQNAEYSIDNKQYSSQSNTVQLDNSNVQVTLLKADGKDVNLSIDPDVKGIISNIKNFAESFNKTMNFAQSYSSKLEGAANLKEELNKIMEHRESALKTIGLSVTDSGTILIDENKLENAVKNSLSDVKNIFQGYNGISEKIYSKTTEVLNSPLKYSKPTSLGKSYNSFYNYMTAVNRSIIPQNIYSGMVFDMSL